MKIHVETERFYLRDIEMSDAQGMFELDSNPKVHEFLGKNPVKSIEEIKDVIHYIRKQYEENGIGRWAIIDKNTKDFVGWTGLKYEKALREEFNYYDLGYRLKEEYWGKGIATETALASLKHGFETLKLDKICGAAEIEHSASNKILQKVGLKFKETFFYEEEEHNWYELERGDWEQLK
ncbi:GNAT family N-acetyltransferase [Aureivirga marina]|uniref:GNAT family N-acetyltransferase n=1 Tax=Aureivirga marina TaxID=1182451 RepID=UPI0018CB9840|nr:GNAT family N-acetyltransferase [Aureivirga marina]